MSRMWIRRTLIAGTTALALGFAMAPPAAAQLKKHHLTVALGYQKFLMNDDLPSIDLPGFQTGGINFNNGAAGHFAYRYSVERNMDLTFDQRLAFSDAGQYTFSTDCFGPGLRAVAPKEGMRPYAQVNVLLVSENFEIDLGDDATINRRKSSVGFSASAGLDLRAGTIVSIPVEAFYLHGKPEHDVSGWGFTGGISFNFEPLE